MFKIKHQPDSTPLPPQDIPGVISKLFSAKEMRLTKYPRVYPEGILRKREINYYRKPEPAIAPTEKPSEAVSYAEGEDISQNAAVAQSGPERLPESMPQGRNPWAEILPQLTDAFLEEKGLKRIAGVSVDTAQRASEGIAENPWVMMLPFLTDEFLSDLGLEAIPGVPRGGWCRRGSGRKGSRRRVQATAPDFFDPDAAPIFNPEDLLDYTPPVDNPDSLLGSEAAPKRRGRKPGRKPVKSSTCDSSEPKRRGRRPGRKAASQPNEESSSSVLNSSDAVTAPAETPPKRRGRKPGSSKNTEPSTQPESIPKRRGRKPGSGRMADAQGSHEDSSSVPATQTPQALVDEQSAGLNVSTDIQSQPKRRGRKPGSKNKPRSDTKSDTSNSLSVDSGAVDTSAEVPNPPLSSTPAPILEDGILIPAVPELKRQGRKAERKAIGTEAESRTSHDSDGQSAPTDNFHPPDGISSLEDDPTETLSQPKRRGRTPKQNLEKFSEDSQPDIEAEAPAPEAPTSQGNPEQKSMASTPKRRGRKPGSGRRGRLRTVFMP